MKQLLLFFIAVSALFGVEVNETNLQDSIQKCNARDKVACREVSRFYGKSASRHNEEATKLWIDYALKGCELRDGESCYTIAYQYDDGGGFPRLFKPDEAKKIEYLTKGCDYKDKTSCRILGIIYTGKTYDAKGTEKKVATIRARQFYKKACDLGDEFACKK